MTLTLRIIERDGPDLGVNPELVLNNRGANIGRALTCEWVLPDDNRVVSSRHCEVQFRENAYFLVDFGSTNGTFINNAQQRLEGTHRIAPGDRIRIGPYLIEARLAGASLHQHQAEAENAAAAARGPDFGNWHDVPGGRAAPPPPPPPPSFADGGGWDLPQAAPEWASVWSEDAARGTGAPSADDIFGNFTAKNEVDWNNAAWSVDPDFDPFSTDADSGAPSFAPLAGTPNGPAPGGGDPFAPLPGGAPPGAFPGGSRSGFDPLPGAAAVPTAPVMPPPPPPQPQPPSGGAFAPLPGASPAPAASAMPPPASMGSTDPFAPLDPAAAPFPAAESTAWPAPAEHEPTVGGWSQTSADPAATAPPPVRMRPSPVAHSAPDPVPAPAPLPHPPAAPPPSPPAAASALPDAVFGALLTELGVPASQLKQSPEETAAKTGRMLRHLIAGLMILLEARARAKEEMGAAGTALSFDGNNPLKFARNVDQALVMMLNPHLRGYMEAEGAIEESYRDLQAHQIATLKAMQGALRETLNRFSPAAIKARTKEQGLLAKVLPGQREAALWKAYEVQFSGVAEGSAEAFLEVFSREFRKAYEESARPPRR